MRGSPTSYRIWPTDGIPRRSFQDSVYDAIRRLVLDHEIAPGARINVDRLARELGVSATPVREALARLDAERLVRREAMRGYTAAPALDGEGFAQLFDMRVLIEPYAARLAATHATPEDLSELEAALEAMRRTPATPTPEEYAAYSGEDRRFHGRIARASGNAFLHEALERLQAHPQLSELYFHYRRTVVRAAVQEHAAILAAIRRGDGPAAEAAAKRHIVRSSQRVHAAMRRE